MITWWLHHMLGTQTNSTGPCMGPVLGETGASLYKLAPEYNHIINSKSKSRDPELNLMAMPTGLGNHSTRPVTNTLMRCIVQTKPAKQKETIKNKNPWVGAEDGWPSPNGASRAQTDIQRPNDRASAQKGLYMSCETVDRCSATNGKP